MGDKAARFMYITNTKFNSAFHPSGISKSSTDLYGLDEDGARSPVSSGNYTV